MYFTIENNKIIPTEEGFKKLKEISMSFEEFERCIKENNFPGRFPSNLIHSGEPEVLAEFAKYGVSKSRASGYNWELSKQGNVPITKNIKSGVHFNDSGTPARFFQPCPFTKEDFVPFYYCAKASRKERGKGNNHPTCKSISLLKYLLKLFAPPNSIVLDPFMGSGSTGVACQQLGYKFVGIEKEKEYVNISVARLKSEEVLL